MKDRNQRQGIAMSVIFAALQLFRWIAAVKSIQSEALMNIGTGVIFVHH